MFKPQHPDELLIRLGTQICGRYVNHLINVLREAGVSENLIQDLTYRNLHYPWKKLDKRPQ